MKLDNRVVLVTGGGTGIGRGIAERFGREGAKVAIGYSQSGQDAEDTAAAIRSAGGAAMTVRANVAVESEVRAMIAAVVEAWGRLDFLINNAGWSTRVPHRNLEALTDEIWDRTLNTNLRGAFYCVRQAMPWLQKQPGAAIVNIASVAGLKGQGSSIAYAASKGAMITMTKSLARAFAPGVRVNAVCPGFVRTRFAGWTEDAFAAGEAMTPLKRLATPEDIAEATLFACICAGMTGEEIVVDGGFAQLGRQD
jgi:3-oxoacyl-[acyl-carrier protein] reductase